MEKLTGVSGRKLMFSQLIPGTWMLPGVLHVACNALRALRLGDLAAADVDVSADATAATELAGTFSLPPPAVEFSLPGVRRLPVK